MDNMPARRRETMGGLAKGLAIIELFADGITALSVADAARGTGATRAAARRCLLTLEDLDYVGFDGRRYFPRPRLRRLVASNDWQELADFATPFLTQARDKIDETISLAVFDRREAFFIARVETPRIIQTGVRAGARLPAYATAAGRVMLSDLPDKQLADYFATTAREARTPKSIVDGEELMRIIRVTRERGWASSDEELELGMRAVAVAVRADRELVAVLTLSTLTVRASLEEVETRHRMILEEAARALGKAYIAKHKSAAHPATA